MLDTTASSIFTTIFPSASSTLFFLGSWLEGGGHGALWEAKYWKTENFPSVWDLERLSFAYHCSLFKDGVLDSVCVTCTCVLAEAREECRCLEAGVTGVCDACASQTQGSSSAAEPSPLSYLPLYNGIVTWTGNKLALRTLYILGWFLIAIRVSWVMQKVKNASGNNPERWDENLNRGATVETERKIN